MLQCAFAQQDSLNVSLRDYHSAEITDVISAKAYPYFFTADASGKILLHNNETKRVVKTIKPASGFPIKNMRLSHNDLMLTINQKIDFSDGSSDSLISIEVNTGKRLLENQVNINFIGNQDNAVIIQDKNEDKTLSIIDLYNNKFEKIYRYFFTGEVTLAAYDFDIEQFAAVEGVIGTQRQVVIQNGTDYENLEKIDIPEGLKVVDIYFFNTDLFVLTHNAETKALQIYNLTKSKDFKVPVFKDDGDSSAFVNINHRLTVSGYQIVVSPQRSFTRRAIVIENKNGNYSTWIPKTKNAITQSLFLEDQNEYLFFNMYNQNFGSAMRYSVYDSDTRIEKGNFPEKERKFYSATYLPNNDWMVIGTDFNQNNGGIGSNQYQIKYYQNGTFNNRFNTLDYADYMELNHAVYDRQIGEFNFNKYTGIHPFYGSKKDALGKDIYGFYAYDLMRDKVKKISTLDVGRSTFIVDYNDKTNTLLITDSKYNNSGTVEPGTFNLVKNEKIEKLDGMYKFGKISKNGQLLLLISEDNTLTVRILSNQKIQYSEILKDGNYSISLEEEQGFIVSNAYRVLDMGSCNRQMLSFVFDDTLKLKRNEIDCAELVDTVSYGDKSYVSLNYLGLVIGEKVLKFPTSDFPTRLSTDKDGKKLMVSFNSGKIKLYDIATTSVIAEMIHPDKDSHVFVDSDGYFFSNMNPQDYIMASRGNKAIDLKDIESSNYKPEKILEKFGKPNQDYLVTLNKALDLRNNSKSNEVSSNDIKKSVISTTNEVTETKPSKIVTESSEKGDLYMLAIGVSDYEQSDYDLTFADKDAMDMTRVYGALSKKDSVYYSNHFLGQRYHLIDGDSGFTKEFRKYSEAYAGTGTLFGVSPNGNRWLEKTNNGYLLWDFKSQSAESINLPIDAEIEAYTNYQFLFVDPDGKGFSLKSENDTFQFYDFKTKNWTSFELPLKKELAYFDSDQLTFTENEGWMYFSVDNVYPKNDIVLSSGKISSLTYTTKRFNPDVFEITDSDGTKRTDTISQLYVSFKSLSSNGKYLIYSDLDKNLYLKDLNAVEKLPTRLRLPKLENLEKITVSNDGKSIAVDGLRLFDENSQLVIYNSVGSVSERFFSGSNLVGHSVFDAKLYKVENYAPIAKEFLALIDAEFEEAQPESFNNVKLKCLINEEATVSKISNELNTFFSNVKPNDQVAVFVAGHGVLDKDLNYYFAPHNMDFKDVSKNGIKLETFLESLQATTTKNKLLLMDSCHSGNTLDIDSKTIVETTTSKKESNERGSKSRTVEPENEFKISDVVSGLFDDFISQSGVTIIAASSGSDVAYENDSMANGAFTSAYLTYLKEQLAILNYDQDDYKKPLELNTNAVDYLLKKVLELTNGKQTPDLREVNSEARIKMW